MTLFDGKHLPLPKAFIAVTVASCAYNLAVNSPNLIGLLPIYFLSLLYISKVEKLRFAFYLGWISSLITFSIHIRFFSKYLWKWFDHLVDYSFVLACPIYSSKSNTSL